MLPISIPSAAKILPILTAVFGSKSAVCDSFCSFKTSSSFVRSTRLNLSKSPTLNSLKELIRLSYMMSLRAEGVPFFSKGSIEIFILEPMSLTFWISFWTFMLFAAFLPSESEASIVTLFNPFLSLVR